MSSTKTDKDYSKKSQTTSLGEQLGRIDTQNSATAGNQPEQYQHSRSSSSNIEKVSFYFPLSYFLLILKPLQIWNIISIPTAILYLCWQMINETSFQIIQITTAEI